jgi:hypothetical protein
MALWAINGVQRAEDKVMRVANKMSASPEQEVPSIGKLSHYVCMVR